MNGIPNGTRVNIIEAGIKGVVIGVCMSGIESQYIEYKVRFWVGGERKTEWVLPDEIEIFIDTSKKAGMVNYETGIEKI